MKNILPTLGLLGAFLGGLLALQPAALAASVKADPLAIRGCISKIPVAASQTIINRYNYKLIGATQMETRSLGTTLTWIERLNGGKPFQLAVARDGYGVRFREKKGNSAQRAGEIAINRNGSLKYGENIAQLAHEIGHLVGNNGMYGDYRAAIGSTRKHPKYCKVSGYSDDKANEQFAEVFAAFVTRPELIKESKDPVCKKAYAFFKRAFSNGALADKCYDAQNDVKAKLIALADALPSAPGAQSAESKARGMKASREDGKTRLERFTPVAIPPLLARADAKPKTPMPSPFVLALRPKNQQAQNGGLRVPFRLDYLEKPLAPNKPVAKKAAAPKPVAKKAVAPKKSTVAKKSSAPSKKNVVTQAVPPAKKFVGKKASAPAKTASSTRNVSTKPVAKSDKPKPKAAAKPAAASLAKPASKKKTV